MSTIAELLEGDGLVFAFLLVGVIMIASNALAGRIAGGRIQGSAIAIIVGLVLAYVGGSATGGEDGIADIAIFSGLALLGGSMLRDFAIVSTAYGVDLREIRRGGATGILSILLGVLLSAVIGASIAAMFGYTDPVSMATIGGGAATYIVGPVTGTALGASSEVIALSVAAGLVKSVLVMVGTPLLAPLIGLTTTSPRWRTAA